MSIELKHAGGPKWQAVNESGEVLNEFSGKRTDVEPEFEAWLAAQSEDNAEVVVAEDAPVQETQEESIPAAPKVNTEGLTGKALTAARNAEVDSTFVEGEWKLQGGVSNEANRVYNVPEGYQVAWSTPRHIDGGRHANYLRERGYRPVYRDEMGTDMYGDALYVAYLDETDSEYTFMGGAQLFIGPSERLAKIRRAEYDAHMAAFNSKQEEDQERAEYIGGELRTKRDSSVYNPMRS